MQQIVVRGQRRNQADRGLASFAALLPPDWPLDLPLVRLSTCGCSPLRIEVLIGFTDPLTYHEPHYASPDEHLWQAIKGRKTALALLAFLASQPHSFVPQDALAQALRPRRGAAPGKDELEWEDDRSLKRIDNVVADLRRLLFPPALASMPEQKQRILRRLLIQRVSASTQSGPGFALASQPLLWLDVEAMEQHAARAARLDSFGDEGLEEWRTVSEIGLCGTFLPHEAYSDWAVWRRTRVRELLWQSIQAQLKALEQWPDQQAAEEAALCLLTACWQAEPTNEDAFRLLAEKLGKHERFEQAEQCYKQLCLALEGEGREPHRRTNEVMEFERTRQIQRKPIKVKRTHITSPSLIIPDADAIDTNKPFAKSDEQDILQEKFSSYGKLDMRSLSRRTLLESAVTLPAVAASIQPDFALLERFSRALSKPICIDTQTLAELYAHTQSFWLYRLQATHPSRTLLSNVQAHFSFLTDLLQNGLTAKERQNICGLGSETAQILGMLFFDLGAYHYARHYFHLALQAAQEVEHPLLDILAWGNLSFAWMYDNDPQRALPCIQEARRLAATRNDVPQMIQMELAAREAEVFSYLGDHYACLKALHSAEEGAVPAELDTLTLGIHFDVARYAGYEGACLRRLAHQKENASKNTLLSQARQALQTALMHIPASQLLRQSTVELDLAEVLLQERDAEQSIQHALQAAIITQKTGSSMITQRLDIWRQDIKRYNPPSLPIFDTHFALLQRPSTKMREL